MVDAALAEELLWILAAGGADFAEIYTQETASLSVSLESGGTPAVESLADGGVSLLIERAGRLRLSSLAGEAPDTMRQEARRLASGAEAATSAPRRRQNRMDGPGPDPGSPDELEALLAVGREAAREADARAAGYSGVAAAWASEVFRADSEGNRMLRRDRRVTVYHRVVAREGPQARQGTRVLRAEGFPPLLQSAGLAAEAARAAALSLEARSGPEGLLPIVLSPQAAGLLFHETLGRLLEADAVLQGFSPFAGKLGEAMGAPALTLRQGTPAGEALDDEGHPVLPVALVETGVLRALLTDRRTASRGGLKRTGSGWRESFRHPPLPRTARLAVDAGEGSLQSLLGEIEVGLFAARLGAGEVDAASGRFRFPAVEAFLVREGEVAEPVSGVALAGTCADLPWRVVRCGGRREVHPGVSRKGGQTAPVEDEAPAVLLEDLQVERGPA